MRRLFGVALLLSLLAIATPVHAGGEASFLVDGVTYTLSTGTGAGSCVVESLGAYLGTEITCRDGVRGEARGNTRFGCLSSDGQGSCQTGPLGTLTPQFDVNCHKGHSFRIDREEGDKDGACSLQVKSNLITGGGCDDGQGNFATVNCGLNEGKGGCETERGTVRCECTTCKP